MVRGKKRELPRKNVNVDVNAAIHNRFDVEVVDAATGQVKKKARAYNVICYQLWSRMFTPTTYFNYIHYGTGEGSPTQSDSKLFHFSGYLQPSEADDVYDFDMDNYTYSLTRKVQINPEVAVGENITEVGIAYDKTEGTICTHAMLQDMNGNPISIEKTATDLINIYATVYLHLPNNLENPTAWFIITNPVPLFVNWVLGKTELEQAIKGCQLNNGLNPNGMAYVNTQNSISQVETSYDLSQRKIVGTAERFQIDSGNVQFGVNGIYILSNATVRAKSIYNVVVLSCENFFEKSVIIGEPVGTGDGATVDFATKFDLPENATVKVDGIAAEATVESVPLFYDDMGRYFIPVKTEGDYIARATNFGTSEVSAGNAGKCETIYYNPYFMYGVKSCKSPFGEAYMYASQDGKTWSENLVKSSGSNDIPEEFKNHKFWKVKIDSVYSNRCITNITADTLTGKNIHFTEPPAEGAVITADYHTPVIAKDDQHVFDLIVTLSFNPYEAT